MGSLQLRNQVADRRAEPDEERAAEFSVVTSGHPSDDFIVPLDDPNEEITEQWQDGLHDWYICRDDQCSVELATISRDVSQKRGYLRFCSCLKRCFVSACTNSQISTPRECDSHSAAGDNAVSVYLTCLDCWHHAKWTHRTGSTFQQFPELQRMVQAWWAKLQQ